MRFISFTIARAALKRNKGRTALTVLGIVIGITAVITVMSAGDGLRSFVIGQIETFGTDVIQIEIKVPSTGKNSTDSSGGIAQGIQITTLTLDDAEAIEKLANIKNTYSSIIGQDVVSYGSENKQILLWGSTSSFTEIDATKPATGRFFTDEEDRSLAQVAVLGSGVVEKLFGDVDPLGASIKIGTLKFDVIGVMESRGTIAFFDMDNFIYIPIRTLQTKVLGVDHINSITAQVYDKNLFEPTAEDIRSLLRDRHDIANPDKDDFGVTTMAEAMDIYNTIFGAINLLLFAVAGISLLVGGIGIMNIMYVSVSERTYEIGLRKAVGATSGVIMLQFLWEAIMMTLIGAAIGFVLGAGLSFLISAVATSLGFGWQFTISPSSVMLAGGISIVIGVVFGVFPARAASKLDPVTALRKAR